MLRKMNDIPGHVAGFVATGNIDKDDYDKVLIPELERITKAHGHIHYLMVLETPVKNFSIGAWMQDAWVGIKHFRGWKKIAIVTDEEAVGNISNKMDWVIPGKTKSFKLSELEEAKEWVAEED